MSDESGELWWVGEWGYCHWCKFDVPLKEDGTLYPHDAGKYAPYAGCARENRMPDTRPHGGVIMSIAKLDQDVNNRVKHINVEDPRED